MTLKRLQREVLRQGELLLDSFTSSDTSLLFAITPDRIAVAGLPGEDALAARLRLFTEAVSAPPLEGSARRPAGLERAARQASTLLLQPFADMVKSCRRIVVCPDGPLSSVAFGALQDPSTTESGVSWLGLDRMVSRAPSAALLAEVRRRSVRGATHGRETQVLVVASSVNAAGEPLTGALREARYLADRYRGVQVRTDDASLFEGNAADSLRIFGLIHIAAHTELNGDHPWRSGVLLRPDLADASGAVWLRAERVLGLRLAARLAVLSGCSSAGGGARLGEGAEGLSAAFLCAGVPTVVATLWPVDDRTTARLVERFYAHLARGATVSRALQHAQREMAATEGAIPFHWAAFTVVGDPDSRVALREKSGE